MIRIVQRGNKFAIQRKVWFFTHYLSMHSDTWWGSDYDFIWYDLESTKIRLDKYNDPTKKQKIIPYTGSFRQIMEE